MVVHPEVFGRDQRLKQPLAASITFHVAIAAALLGWSWYEARNRDSFGDPNSIPGAGTITPVDAIPMPPRAGRVNPVANDTESQVPARPKPEVRRVEPDDPDAVVLDRTKRKKQKEKKKVQVARTYNSERTYDRNQVFSSTGAALATPMFATKGGGGVGVGTGNPFGKRLGWYVDLIREAIGQKWRSQDVDSSVTNSSVIVVFDIQRSGQVSNVRLAQRSSNYTLDNSAIRAVQEASPLPQLPKEFERNTATVEFHFQLKR